MLGIQDYRRDTGKDTLLKDLLGIELLSFVEGAWLQQVHSLAV